MRLVVPTVRGGSGGAFALAQPLARQRANSVGDLRLGLHEPLELRTVEREAAQGRLRDDPRAAETVFLEERDLADDLSAAELSFVTVRTRFATS